MKGTTLVDRLDTQAAARKAMLERFRARPPVDDPDVLARQAERKAVAEARDTRRAERAAVKKADEEKIAAEKLAREMAELERLEREASERAQRQADLLAYQKAKRDERYASRKTRVKKR